MLTSDFLKREWAVESGEKLLDVVLSAGEFVVFSVRVEEMNDVGLAEQVDRDARVGFEQDARILPADGIECLFGIEVHAAFVCSGTSIVVRIDSQLFVDVLCLATSLEQTLKQQRSIVSPNVCSVRVLELENSLLKRGI